MNNAAHLHTVLSHFTISFPLIGLALLLVGMLFRSNLAQRFAYFLFIVVGVLTFFMMNSGEGAEEIVEELGRSHHQIHEHEEHAEKLAVLNYILATLGLLGIWISLKLKKYSVYLNVVSCIVALAVLWFTVEVAQEGGKITHVEAYENVEE